MFPLTGGGLRPPGARWRYGHRPQPPRLQHMPRPTGSFPTTKSKGSTVSIPIRGRPRPFPEKTLYRTMFLANIPSGQRPSTVEARRTFIYQADRFQSYHRREIWLLPVLSSLVSDYRWFGSRQDKLAKGGVEVRGYEFQPGVQTRFILMYVHNVM